MIKSLKLILFLTVSLSAYADNDTVLFFKKNHFEIGISNANYFDEFGFKNSKLKNNRIGINDFNISYSRTLYKNFFVSIQYFQYNRNDYMDKRNQIDYSSLNHGDILKKQLTYYNLEFGNSFNFKYKPFISLYLKPKFSINYLKGINQIFLGSFSGGFDFASTPVESKGIGIGLANDFGISLFKRLTISTTIKYNYTFDKGNYTEESPPFPRYYKYLPSRNIIIIQPKIGFLF